MTKNPSTSSNDINDEPFVLTRSFDAPRDLVWKVWTQSEHLGKWFSPKGFKILAAKMDFRVGGTYHYGLQMPDGKPMWGKWEFQEIAAPERIVLIQCFSDEKGGLTRHPMAPDWPQFTLSTMTFAAQGNKTKFTLTWAPYKATEVERKTFDAGRAGMQQGWGGTMEQFNAYLAKMQSGRAS
jgi:uncharacterized protein YndB with AHSA1/START domain